MTTVTILSDLKSFSDNELRIVYRRMMAFLKTTGQEMIEVEEDIAYYADQLLHPELAQRKSEAYVWAALDEIQGTFKSTVRHESPETLEWSSMGATYTHLFDEKGFLALTDELFKRPIIKKSAAVKSL